MDERDERKRTSGDASKRFRRHQNWSCTTAPGRVWRKPTYWPRGARCIGGMTLVRALVRNLRTCPAMPREKVQAAKLRGRKYRCGGQGRTAPYERGRGVMPVERRGQVTDVGSEPTGNRRSSNSRREAAAFVRWHEPDDARVSSPDV